MPVLPSPYNPPLLFRNGHAATIYAGLFRRVDGINQERERLELEDGDFMDLDWSYAEKPSQKVAVLLHGLEGHGQRPYITGSAKIFNRAGIDACAVNFRGCSGETNRLYRSYHSGATEDLHAVILHILETGKYTDILIKGISLGGNMAMKYLGEGRTVPKEVKAAIGVSVPCDLHDSLIQLLKPKNWAYAHRFRNHLIAKLRAKQKLYPELITDEQIQNIRTLKDFDDLYTSKAHGFRDALDYYEKCSSGQFLNGIQVPALIINSLDDSFLGEACYPQQEAEKNPKLYLRMPRHGGHVGFIEQGNISYSEKVSLSFVSEFL
ncbi:YheT family hydrolase [Lentiprolixibacter aurantiacus]|uniref:Alpha/beta fold hydrolase n=1 Tax=Lentiprolixibacter aurantiacus TaxID=2993939 RepID=A0AAE3MJN2_9FLAO|nr:alpha/beta fold hydrolase [Lentiprolixibacter aurantiacus]MCX2718342.1 alpha/beta fold hydrolase [Lentiprolixibacter aurantiacus]